MERSVTRWNNLDPEVMALQSKASIAYALEDAKKDILSMARILKVAAYPRKGTIEMTMDEYDLATMIQHYFSLEDLEIDG